MHDTLRSDQLLDLIPLQPLEPGQPEDLRKSSNVPRSVEHAYRTAGPIFRARPLDSKWVVMAGAEANQFVWNSTELWDYPIMFPSFLEQMGPDHLNNIEGKVHTAKRAALKEGMDRAAVMRHLPGYHHWFAAELERKAGSGPVDLIEFWATTILKANSKTVSRVELSDEEIHRVAWWEEQMLQGLGMGEARHAHYAREEYIKGKEESFALLHRMVEERIAAPERWDDAYADVLRARRAADGTYAERHCLVDDLYYLLIAGIHNTARWINVVLLVLHFSPEWQRRVLEELAAWDGKDVMALGGMECLKAVVLETQRLRPVVHFTVRHPKRDFEFGGYTVPAGTNILVCNTCCHFLTEFFDEPFRFKPERFLDGGKFAPRTNGFFGGGVHVCVGRNFATLQTPLAVADLLKRYDLSYADEAGMRALAEDIGTVHAGWDDGGVAGAGLRGA